MVAVVTMGVLIVGGTVTLGVLIVQRLGGAPAAQAAPLMLDEPAGTRIAGMAASGDRLALQLQGGGPDRVVLLDAHTGRLAARVSLTH
jgi:hypothetical protein